MSIKVRKVWETNSAIAVANYFIDNYSSAKDLTPLKLQKLVYLSHAWHLALEDSPLVEDESVEAWQYGPVFSSLYHELKGHGSRSVRELATDIVEDENDDWVIATPRLRGEFHGFLDRVWATYGNWTPGQLSTLTHTPGSPWSQTNRELRNAHIDDSLITRYYKEKVANRARERATRR